MIDTADSIRSAVFVKLNFEIPFKSEFVWLKVKLFHEKFKDLARICSDAELGLVVVLSFFRVDKNEVGVILQKHLEALYVLKVHIDTNDQISTFHLRLSLLIPLYSTFFRESRVVN